MERGGILNGYAGDIVSYNVSKRPDFLQITDMMDKAFLNHTDTDGLILHSDQGFQYTNIAYVRYLEEKGITISHSRKANCYDNACCENFFGLLKTEMYYDQEHFYRNTDELIRAIEEYIYYYNNERIKGRLKGLTPAEYRNQALMNP